MASAVIGSLIGTYDLKMAQQWRDEDISHRAQEKQWRDDDIKRAYSWRNEDVEREKRLNKLENERRITDARSEQLSAVSNLSALLGGFAMVANVEISLPDDVSNIVMFFYGTTSAAVILCMLCCMLMCTLLLLAITQYASQELETDLRHLSFDELDVESPFYVWWLKRCEQDWLLAYKFFRMGIFLFLCTVSWVGWVQFEKTAIAGIGMTAIAALSFIFWQVRIESKWRYLLYFPETKIPPSMEGHGDDAAYLSTRTHSVTKDFSIFHTPATTSMPSAAEDRDVPYERYY
ncbi:hypothetical protein DYB25_007413 [Aphanomyces astaci]|uniref:Calcium release-activated calcium channel protein 1 n=2 Tax=Aphanomyces astaci TaxID=112090 RepID=A0A397CVJ8_APHAT|nr:hypothetical protein DYB25_007413 [Aphanomyces astaci]RHY39278.1 hypothetical protein DYB34_005035 [Aphanomyces astaci]RHY52774.1 hypothetical protein DYB38_002573 [Aphanomyces astaci]